MQQEDSLYVVSNAGCAEKDLAHIRSQLAKFQQQGGEVEFNVIDDHSLIAIQGPKAAAALQELVKEDLSTFPFMNGKHLDVNGIPCHVARSGYTGEDGFEVIITINIIIIIRKTCDFLNNRDNINSNSIFFLLYILVIYPYPRNC